MPEITIDYYTLRKGQYGGIDVVGWFVYPESSVLAGQTGKKFINNFKTEQEAVAAFPQVTGYSSPWMEPQINLRHLPGEDDPVPGGMYPDDIRD